MTPDEPSSAGTPGPGLKPPGTHPHPTETRSGNHGLVWLALAVVVVLGLAVLLLLPRLVSNTADDGVEPIQEQVAVPPEQAPVQDSANSQADAEQALQDFLHARARLELANVAAWGEPEWSQAIEGADKGNNHFSQRQFSMATEAFKAATGLLLLLESGRDQRLAVALDSGWQALQANDSVSAMGYFETAKAIDAGSLDALEGLERARVRPEILQLMNTAEQALINNELALAQSVYRDAVDLDNTYEPALTALQDVSTQIDELAFNDAMSRALSALEAEQVGTAEAALQEAASLKPNAEVVQFTRRELEETRQKLWLESQRKAAARAESNEDWSDAVAIYTNVLARMPQAAFARQGMSFAQDRARLHQQLDHYLQDPTRVYSDLPRKNAEDLIKSAANPPAKETRLADKVRRLKALIVEATTPRMVTLNSDGLTSVKIYHVGVLGQFTSQQLELRPGTYTVVGSRPGYRDVRRTLTVEPGTQQQAVDIRCEETI